MPGITEMRASVDSRGESVAEAALAPVTIRRRRRVPLGGLLLAIAGIWLAVSLRALHAGALEALPGAGMAGPVCAIVIAAALALIGLGWIARCDVVVLGQGLIRVTARRLTGHRVFEEPLARYHGLRLRCERLPHRYGRRSWYVVEAWHQDPAKTIELARSKDPRRVEQLAEDWARRLVLPMCQEPDARSVPLGPSAGSRLTEAASSRPLPAYSAPSHH